MRTLKICFLLLFIALVPALSVSPPSGAVEMDDDSDGQIDHWETYNEQGGLSIFMDTDGDGAVDYIIEHDDEGYKFFEALDFNGDGELDDYYFYVREVLERREIDSNFDGNVDVWVYLAEGVYIERYERDTDFDGIVDFEKKYGEN